MQRRLRSSGCEAGRTSVDEELGGEAGVVAVGAEPRSGDDEAVDAEIGECFEALDHPVGCAGDRKAVDELAGQRRGVRGVVAQVLVAVVCAPDLGNDGAVLFGQPGTRRTWHRGEVGERRDTAVHHRSGHVDVRVTADADVRPEGQIGRVATGVVRRGSGAARCPTRRARDRPRGRT